MKANGVTPSATVAFPCLLGTPCSVHQQRGGGQAALANYFVNTFSSFHQGYNWKVARNPSVFDTLLNATHLHFFWPEYLVQGKVKPGM